MPSDIDRVLSSLEIESDEPCVLVDPTLEAFCLMRTRSARGTSPPRPSRGGRLPLAAIIAYMRENGGGEATGA
jgi:hypothetical protein